MKNNNELVEFLEKIKNGEITDIKILIDKIKDVVIENPNDYDLGKLVRDSFLIK